MESDKWKQPGWRIEQKYSNRVLIGNWAEERLQFTRDCKTATSTYHQDYRPYRDHKPDVFLRREGLRRSEGLPAKLLLDHHGTPHSYYLVSLYDENYGRKSSSALPTLRSWNHDKLAWVPERSDHPAQAPPTNFGLTETRLARSDRLHPGIHMLSVYRSTYPWHTPAAFCQARYASVPRTLSSHLHPANRINKDLGLKGRPHLQVPDHPARLLPRLSAVHTHGSTTRPQHASPGTSEAAVGNSLT